MTLEPIIQQGPVAIYELLGSSDKTRGEALLNLYARLFPQYAHYVPRMQNRLPFPSANSRGHIVHYWLVEVDGQPAGLRTFRCIPTRRCGLAHALAIDPSFRSTQVKGQRLSTFVIYSCLEQVIRDAEERSQPAPFGMVNEVESERLMAHYCTQGIIRLPVRYMEPIFPPPDQAQDRAQELKLIRFAPMFLGLLPNPNLPMQNYSAEILKNFVLAFLVDHYGLPENHKAVQLAMASILETVQEKK